MVLGTARKGSPAEKAVESLVVFSVPVCSNSSTNGPAFATDRSPESADQRLFLWICVDNLQLLRSLKRGFIA